MLKATLAAVDALTPEEAGMRSRPARHAPTHGVVAAFQAMDAIPVKQVQEFTLARDRVHQLQFYQRARCIRCFASRLTPGL